MRALLQIVLLFSVTSTYADEYVPSFAVDSASRIARQEKKELYVYFVNATSGNTEAVVPDVSKLLCQVAQVKASVAILGSDYEQNATILKLAFKRAAKDSLEGITVIVVNNVEDFGDLTIAAAPTGATVRVTGYSPPAASWRDSQFCPRTTTNEMELSSCLNEQAQLAENELNETYQKVMAKRSTDQKNALRQEERKWIKWREAECARQVKDVEECINGCGVPWTMHVVCMTSEANFRTDELKDKWGKSDRSGASATR